MNTYLTLEETRTMLKVETTNGAKSLLKRLGVKPIYLGKGRGLGYRYLASEIDDALLSLREPRSKPFLPQRKSKGATSYFKKTWGEAQKEMNNPK